MELKRTVLGKDDKGERNGNYGYRKASFFPTEATRNRLASLGVPRIKHDIVSLGEMLPGDNTCASGKMKGGEWLCALRYKDVEFVEDTEAEARGLMLAYLIENSLIKV